MLGFEPCKGDISNLARIVMPPLRGSKLGMLTIPNLTGWATTMPALRA
jgi:hypothetical protein